MGDVPTQDWTPVDLPAVVAEPYPADPAAPDRRDVAATLRWAAERLAFDAEVEAALGHHGLARSLRATEAGLRATLGYLDEQTAAVLRLTAAALAGDADGHPAGAEFGPDVGGEG